MSEREVSPARLEAISDGVIAVILTIMVLELHPPKGVAPAGLLALWPQFTAYVVSFGFVATYWVNHRYVFSHLRRVDERVLWSNMALLFMLSLIPFSTAYAGASGLAPFPTAFYAGVMLANALSYWLLSHAIESQHARADEPLAFRRRVRLAGNVAAVGYALAIPAAFLHPAISLGLAAAISVYYMTPLPRPPVLERRQEP